MTSRQPLVTVGLTTRNRSRLLRSAIESVLAQSYENFELFVIDDVSSDDTPEVVASLTDRKLVSIRNEANLGLAAGRNLALNRASGDYITFLDDDDAWEKEKLERQVALAEGTAADCAVVYCGGIVVDEDGAELGHRLPTIRGRIRNVVVEGRLSTIPSANLFRTQVLREAGGHDVSLPSHVDHDVWMELARLDQKADYVDAPLVRIGSHLGHRMTAEVDERWRATHAYFNKWRHSLVSWMGEGPAREYEARYFLTVMEAVGREAMVRGDLGGSARTLARIVSRWPVRVSTYTTGARMFAGSAVDRLPFLRRAFRHPQRYNDGDIPTH